MPPAPVPVPVSGSNGSRAARRRLTGSAVAALVVAGMLSGCSDDAVADPGAVTPAGQDWPAALPGGACTLLNYETVEAAVGVRFTASAAAEAEGTNTCALTSAAGKYPDLVLAVTPSNVDKASYVASMPPAGAVTVAQLGQTGYRIVVPARDDLGPQVEVGWLSANGRLMSLRYTCPPETAPDQANGLVGKMIELARTVDKGNN